MNLRMEALVVAGLLLCLARETVAAPFSDFLTTSAPDATVVYRKVDNAELSLYLFRPPGWNAGDNLPAILCIHGGAWVAGDATGFFPHARYFASRGMVASSVQYRLLSATSPTRLADQIDDCGKAIAYLRQHGEELGIDPHRIAAIGDSAGGHLAACLATTLVDPAERVDAAIACNPIVDLTDGQWFKYAVGGSLIASHAPPTHPTNEQLDLARGVSPLMHIAPGLPPMLVMHGMDDKIVSPEQSKQFCEKMKAAGNRCELKLIEHARHAFIIPKYTAPETVVVQAIRDADRFLQSLGYLKGEATLTISDPPAWTVPHSK
jgi:acetyl esterase/lipase